jgi:hypothetical protein
MSRFEMVFGLPLVQGAFDPAHEGSPARLAHFSRRTNMITTVSLSLRHSLAFVAAAALLVGCADEAPLAPEERPETSMQFARELAAGDGAVLATLRRATAQYHSVDKAIADGFVEVACEVRPGHTAAGLLYANFERVADGVIDLEKPEGLLYDASGNGPPKLAGVDLAVPAFDAGGMPTVPPELLGNTFYLEEEFGVWGLHVWIWRHNPEGMFAEGNPNVSC